jgi:hypothetical protein
MVPKEDNDNYDEYLKQRITHILSIYPELSPSMIQVALGASISSRWWKPVLEQMVNEGTLARRFAYSKGPGGKGRSYTLIRLNENRHGRTDVFRTTANDRDGDRDSSPTSAGPNEGRPSEVRADPK